MKTLIKFPLVFVSITLLTSHALIAQPCNDYPCVIRKVNAALASKNYRLAFEQLESANNYPQKKESEIVELRKKLFNAVEKEKQDAIVAKNESNKAKTETADALDKLKLTAKEAVLILLEDIDRNIIKLEYDSCFRKCQTAVKLDENKDDVKKRIIEIAYFYTIADTLEGASKILNLLNFNTSPNRIELLTVIEKIAPEYLKELNLRYFPVLLDVIGGTFTMQDSTEKYEVKVDDFSISQSEITFFQYNVFAKSTKHFINNPSWQYSGNNPAVNINWYDAVLYSNWLSEKWGFKRVYNLTNEKITGNEMDFEVLIDTFKSIRLPKDDEWLFAAKGGNSTKGFEFSGDSMINNIAWYNENSGSRSQNVMTKKPNELGLYDMSGNVWEWTQDWYSPKLNVSNEKKLLCSDNGIQRMAHGGSWNGTIKWCRLDTRYSMLPRKRYVNVGFRIARGN